MSKLAGCGHCEPKDQADRLWEDEQCRAVLIHNTGFEGWCRVIWTDHVRELSDLTSEQRDHIMDVVNAVEMGLIKLLVPAKINLAALGTAAPHLHFHIVPRFTDDPSFPDPVWLAPVRTSDRILPSDFADAMKAHLAGILGMSTDGL